MTESIAGLHLFQIHDPDLGIHRVCQMQRSDGAPRIHKLMVHGDNCDWLDRMPENTIWIIRNWNLSEERFASVAEAEEAGRRHAQAHRWYADSAAAKGIEVDRLIFEGRNEPQPAEFQYLNSYECARIAEAQRLGLPRLALFQFSVGQPNTFGWRPDTATDWTQFEAVHRAMRPGDVIGLHEYFGREGPRSYWPDGKPRWPDEPCRHLQCPWMDVRFVVSEAGMDDGVNQRPKSGWHDLPGTLDERAATYLSWVQWQEREMLLDGRVIAVTLFTHDYENNEWEKFDITPLQFFDSYLAHICNGLDLHPWGDKRTAQWESLVKYYANRYGIQPETVGTVLALESAGRVNALSSVGAVGLMQVMSRECGLVFADRPERNVLLHPANNLDWGCRILADNMRRAGGRLDLALCWYYGAQGPDTRDGQVYVSAFRSVWGQLWPGRACPLDGAVVKPPVQPPPVTPPPEPERPTAEVIRNVAWNSLYPGAIPYNPDAAFPKQAKELGAGLPVTHERRLMIDGTPHGEGDWILQGYLEKILYTRFGEWDEIEAVDWL